MTSPLNFHDLEVQHYWTFPAGYKKDAKAETQNMIFSGDYIGARKIDGAFYKFWKDYDGKMELLGRSKGVGGDYLNKIDWVPQLHPFFESLPNGTCLIGEIYFPNNEGSNKVTTIMGCGKEKGLLRQEKGDKLHYYIFDILAYEGKSYLEYIIEDRIEELNKCWRAYGEGYHEWAKYYDGEKLWDHLQEILADGKEGIVITKKGTYYQPGKSPARQTLKVKKEIQDTIDCFFTGHITTPTREYTGKEIETWTYWQNIRTGEKHEGLLYDKYVDGAPIEPITKSYFNGVPGSLEIGVVKGDKVVPIGFLSGLPEEIKANYEKYKGRCIEVTAMQLTEDGALRHGKMVQFRDDLTIKECTFEKIFGK